MISEAEYAKSYREVWEILKYIPKKYFEKVPSKLVTYFEENMDKTYDYKVNPNVSYLNNEKSEITEAILGNMFRDYWANPAQREFILKKEEQERRAYEEKKKILYNPDNIFDQTEDEVMRIKSEGLIATETKKSFFSTIIEKIKSIFKK